MRINTETIILVGKAEICISGVKYKRRTFVKELGCTSAILASLR